jgi:hypothetical protein
LHPNDWQHYKNVGHQEQGSDLWVLNPFSFTTGFEILPHVPSNVKDSVRCSKQSVDVGFKVINQNTQYKKILDKGLYMT